MIRSGVAYLPGRRLFFLAGGQTEKVRRGAHPLRNHT